MTVVLMWCRYGCKPVRLSVDDIVVRAGYSRRTVKRAITALIKLGLLRRAGRYKVFIVEVEMLVKTAGLELPDNATTVVAGGARKLAPPTCQQAGTSPTSIQVSLKNRGNRGVFTAKQIATIQDVLQEASELLGSDAAALQIPKHFLTQLGLPEGTTYATAMVASRQADCGGARPTP